MSDETIPTPKKRGRPRKATLNGVPTDSISASHTPSVSHGPLVAQDSPGFDPPVPAEQRRKKQVQVIERRLKGGALFNSPSRAVPLKDKRMIPRWFNRGISSDRFYVAENEKGYLKVHVNDVESLDAVSGYDRTPEGYITRGPRGEEMLFMIAATDYEAITATKQQANIARLNNPQKRVQAAAEATAATFGPQAGEYIENVEGGIESWKGPAD